MCALSRKLDLRSVEDCTFRLCVVGQVNGSPGLEGASPWGRGETQGRKLTLNTNTKIKNVQNNHIV